MGELRPEYEPALIRAMLASGMDAITITLCDPKPEGAEAFALAVDSLLAHDRFIAALYREGYDFVVSIEHEDRAFEGNEELVKRGFLIARDALRPFLH